uniref:GOLD domain-containing protein n=1 Tax=Coccolithus braarudii TaxID=221442 RepID=A0A7S0Q8I2_9EUKA|mmetsp:Transcript_47016/g.100363  ORF Transcript_47016/g.100363 Transcript_47016/m.100363 type:complete len:212 (+) Transcript_47016:208-843(+)
MSQQSPLLVPFSILCGLATLFDACDAFTFVLSPSASRCVHESLMPKSLLTGEWTVVSIDASLNTSSGSTEVALRSPKGGTLFESGEPSGHFAVTALDHGLHSVCVKNSDGGDRQVSISMKTALEVEDHGLVAKKEHVEAIEAELDRMEKMVEHVYEEMNYMRSRSELMQSTDASTRGRLLWVEVAMLCTLMAMGLWQIHYLKRYFQTKKIL